MDEVITKAQLMERTGLSRATVQRMMKRGMPYTKYYSGQTSFIWRDVVDWMAKNEYAPADIVSKLKRRNRIDKRIRKPRSDKK